MNAFLQSALKANRAIYKKISRTMDKSCYTYLKTGAGGDRSSGIDLLAEEIFTEHLSIFGQIVSEESGVMGEEGDIKIVLDPIDGSDNLLSGFPYFGTSVAMIKNGKTLSSMIVNLANGDVFAKDEQTLYYGRLDNGKFEKRERCGISKIGIFEKAYANPDIVKKISKAKLKFRSPGALALSMAYAYDTEFLLYAGKIREYDIAAGLHQCEEMHTLLEENLLLICKDKEKFDMLYDILKS
ncbi:inositol monophosphatase family protein [Nitrosophilus alvini]|uniref:inositol monophosphatase family protein n=1 Tax=Nitrosophilus alvini TaxID=2714855 RepID=UPI00190C0CFC|nr:inositol monophosphatase family protein [Nitrosophilus alvini]